MGQTQSARNETEKPQERQIMSQRTPVKVQPVKPRAPESATKQFKPSAEDEERYRVLFNSEEQEAEQRDRLGDVALCKRTCSEISALFDEIATLKSNEVQNPKVAELINEKRIDALMKMMTLKKLNRLTQTRLRRVRERTNEARVHVDTRNAQLENSQYELVQLDAEIRKCLDFASREERIDLVSEDELLEAFRKGGRTTEAESLQVADSHARNVARLNYELTERTRLEEAATRLRNDCDAVRAELERRESYLDAVLPHCRKLAEAVRPLEAALGLRQSDTIEQHALAQYLPDSLYNLYLHLEALAQADADGEPSGVKRPRCVAVELDGDLETTRAWYDCGYLEKIEEETDADWLSASRPHETDDDADAKGAVANKRRTRAHGQNQAKKRKTANGQSGSSSDSDADEDDSGVKQQPTAASKRTKPSAIASARLFVAHPIAIVLKLTVLDEHNTPYTFALRIEYLIRLKLATCKFVNPNDVCDAVARRVSDDRSAVDVRAIVSNVLHTDGLLANLLALTRDGDAFAPTHFNALQFKRSVDAAARSGFASREVRAQFGVPFSWLQAACGMNVLYDRQQPCTLAKNSASAKRPSQPSVAEPQANSVEQLVDAIRSRFAYRVRVAQELVAIANGSCVPARFTSLWSVSAFEPLTVSDLRQSTIASRLVRSLLSACEEQADNEPKAEPQDTKETEAESGQSEDDQYVSRFDFCFRLLAKRTDKLPEVSGNVRLNTYLLVPHRDCSAARPLLIIGLEQLVDDRVVHVRSAENDTRLFEIERKLNVAEAESAGRPGDFDLLARLSRLFEYVEVYLNVDGASASRGGDYQHLRAGKGPSRMPPLCKVEQLNLLVHDDHT